MAEEGQKHQHEHAQSESWELGTVKVADCGTLNFFLLTSDTSLGPM